MTSNYYAILNVSADASKDEIKQAYRQLVRLHHPDLNAQTQDETIKRLNEAYEVLSNPHKRAAYDERIRKASERSQAEQRAREPRMTWAQGMAGFVRELKAEMGNESSPQTHEPKLTWAQGASGFMRELKKELKDE
jgi:curved DNA-binding protein CbpA